MEKEVGKGRERGEEKDMEEKGRGWERRESLPPKINVK